MSRLVTADLIANRPAMPSTSLAPASSTKTTTETTTR
jgi:hypothetical protein